VSRWRYGEVLVIKTSALLLVLVLALGGCASRKVSLPRNEAAAPARFQDVLVVAMEPPPLMVPPRFQSAILGTLPNPTPEMFRKVLTGALMETMRQMSSDQNLINAISAKQKK
jgi:hypothetical protein